jgi:ATP/maltotriose-dependent transcriptional regulator MalT
VIPLLEELEDDLGLAKAWWLKSEVHVNACRWGERAQNLERALEHARRAGDASEQSTLASQLVQAVYYGSTPVNEAIARCEDVLADRPDDRSLRAAVTGSIAGLSAMKGDFAEARRLQRNAQALHEELGQRFRVAARSLVAAEIESLAGRRQEAIDVLRWGVGELQAMGITSAMSTIAAFLAESLALEQSVEEALHYSRLSEEQAAEVDIVTQVMWRAARSRVEGDTDLATEAVGMAMATDYPDLKARALLALAQVSGDASYRRLAVEHYERKGNLAAVARVASPILPS